MMPKSTLLQLNKVGFVYSPVRRRQFSRSSILRSPPERNPAIERETNAFALSEITFNVMHGERIGILGKNGSGKTSLLQVISGLLEPSTGNLMVEGSLTALTNLSVALNSQMSGRENAYLRLRLEGESHRAAMALLPEIESFADLGGHYFSPMSTYSAGMAIRLGFSTMTALSRDLLVIDEWLAVGDFEFRRKAEDRLLKLVDTSGALVLASHNREVLEKVCTRGIWLEAGRVRMLGPIAQVTSSYFGH